MLSSLLIKNYALIRHLEMQPSSGLNIITGETGAGKSIMLGAIGLLMGNRADTRILLHKEYKCVVEGTFNLERYSLQALFESNDWDYDSSTIIRREVSSKGKSRAFINDSPVKLEALKLLGEHLLDVHSQNDTMKLSGQEFQLNVLDVYGNHLELRTDYQEAYQKWAGLNREYEQLLSKSRDQQKQADYQKYLLDELESVNLDAVEQEQLEESLRLMENAEEIKLQINNCVQVLEEGDFGATQQLTSGFQMLGKIAAYAPQYQSLKERLESTLIEIRDIARELNHLDQQVEHDPTAIEELKSRLDVIYRLQRKHEVNSLKELINIRERLSQEAYQLLHLDDTLMELKQQIEAADIEIMTLGAKLRDKRNAIFPEFKQRMEELLAKLGMQESTLNINAQKSDPSINGIEKIQWLFSANKGVAAQPINRVASGGEFSRLMFCIKYLIADKVALPTILFDEIDTGISGEVALRMIEMMHQMANSHQVIAISHLPQFAAKADHHYFVYKESDDQTTNSGIKRLTGQARIEAVANMLGGNNPTEIAYANARELLGIDQQESSRLID